jgi:uncharacterized membrane protein
MTESNLSQLEALIAQMLDLIKLNQRVVTDVIKSNVDLRNELSRIPSKLDDLITQIKQFISLVEAAGMEEAGPASESMKPLSDSLKKMVEQNQRLIENNQAILEALDNMNKKLRTGTPVSQLLSMYPNLKLRREVK